MTASILLSAFAWPAFRNDLWTRVHSREPCLQYAPEICNRKGQSFQLCRFGAEIHRAGFFDLHTLLPLQSSWCGVMRFRALANRLFSASIPDGANYRDDHAQVRKFVVSLVLSFISVLR